MAHGERPGGLFGFVWGGGAAEVNSKLVGLFLGRSIAMARTVGPDAAVRKRGWCPAAIPIVQV